MSLAIRIGLYAEAPEHGLLNPDHKTILKSIDTAEARFYSRYIN